MGNMKRGKQLALIICKTNKPTCSTSQNLKIRYTINFCIVEKTLSTKLPALSVTPEVLIRRRGLGGSLRSKESPLSLQSLEKAWK